MLKQATLLLSLFISISITAQRKNVAILVFNGVQIIDYTGPYETFGQAGCRVYTVSYDTAVILTSMNMKVIPSYSFADAPQADILVIPGGSISHSLGANDPIVQWILKQYEKAEWVMSVCNGAFVLGSCGLLDGKRATTTAGMVDHLAMAGTNIKPVMNERFVQDGKIITTGGLSAGIDGSLHIISKLYSEARAREVANQMEYNWDANTVYARGKLADLLIAQACDFNPPLRNKRFIAYEGDETKWRSEFYIKRNESAAAFYKQFTDIVSRLSSTRWKMQKEEINDGQINSEWQVTGVDKKKWTCVVNIGPGTEKDEIHVLFDIKSI